MQRQLLETRPLPLFRLLQLPDLIIELSGSRGFATWHEQRRNVGNAQKKRKRRIENARLRDWMANEDRISWVADREDITPRSATDARSPDQKSWSAWRHMQSVYGSRKNNNNNNNSKGALVDNHSDFPCLIIKKSNIASIDAGTASIHAGWI
jgi:hypothetical protein